MNKFASFAALMLLHFSCLAYVVNGGNVANGGNIANGDFETWLDARPAAWTTIDNGIVVSRSSTQVFSGQSSARVRVDTGTQAATDIRQSLEVSAGESYDFSLWVYHTEGHVRARLYVDGYRNYSNEALTGQWQQIQYRYTATDSKTIEVGLRFYDAPGFDGSEAVYIDDFQPSADATPPPPTDDCSGADVVLRLQTDNYGNETSWELRNSSDEVVYGGSNYASNTLYEGDLCLNPGAYTLSFFDSYGDGICCRYGDGYYRLALGETVLASGSEFGFQDSSNFTVASDNPSPGDYYRAAAGLSGFELKTALHDIIKGHENQGYAALWGFYQAHELDRYYENDGSILDIYSERPSAGDAYNFVSVSDQCGSYQNEGDCYNREHSFPRSWFGGQNEPMNSDVHHIFASDGFVNAQRGSYPYGEVASPTFTSRNGSRLGLAHTNSGYSGTVFEPIDEFKGDIARAQFYMAARYEDRIFAWEGNSSNADAVLDGSAAQVFEDWYLQLLKSWHAQDPVSAKERARNDAAYEYQGNRNPFVDHPEFVSRIWGN